MDSIPPLRNEHGQRVFAGSATQRAADPEAVAALVAQYGPPQEPADDSPAEASSRRKHSKDGD
jgi:hypothetical protein